MSVIKVKNNGKWETIPIIGGAGISDAPSDGTIYGRQDGNWVEIDGSGVGKIDQNSDGTGEIFNFEFNEATGINSHSEGGGYLNPSPDVSSGFFEIQITSINVDENYYITSINGSNFFRTAGEDYIIYDNDTKSRYIFNHKSSSSTSGGHKVQINPLEKYSSISSLDLKKYSVRLCGAVFSINTASGSGSHAEGVSTTASGNASHAEGYNTAASGIGSHTEGFNTIASKTYSHAEGSSTTASGNYSHSEGSNTIASGINSHAENERTAASGLASHAEGYYTTALGTSAHSEGSHTIASKEFSHSEGHYSMASGSTSHAEGNSSLAIGECSHVEGVGNITLGNGSHVEGGYSENDLPVIIEVAEINTTDKTFNMTPSAVSLKGNFYLKKFDDVFKVNILSNQFVSGKTYKSTYSDIESLIYGSDISRFVNGEYSRSVNSNISSGINSHAEGYNTISSGQESHAEGNKTIASGKYTHAEGYNNEASADNSHVEGIENSTTGVSSHAEGTQNITYGRSSHAEGYHTRTHGIFSHSEGRSNDSIGEASHTEGCSNHAEGKYSHAEGNGVNSTGTSSHAEGFSTTSSGDYSHAEGHKTTASGSGSHAEGYSTTSSGLYSHAEGGRTVAQGNGSHSEGGYSNIENVVVSEINTEGKTFNMTNSSASLKGYIYLRKSDDIFRILITDSVFVSGHTYKITYDNIKSLMYEDDISRFTNNVLYERSYYDNFSKGINSHTEGEGTFASEKGSHAEGGYTIASGLHSHAEGEETIASGISSHSEGSGTTSSGQYSHSEGQNTSSTGQCAHSEGYNNKASDFASHAEGVSNTASGYASHTEGNMTKASGQYSHAEGFSTTASNITSHSEGYSTTASGQYSHAEGYASNASGNYSHAEGYRTKTHNNDSHAEGNNSVAYGGHSHAEGYQTQAIGNYAHAEGGSAVQVAKSFYIKTNDEVIAEWERLYKTSTEYVNGDGFSMAKGKGSHSEGKNTLAMADYSHSGGEATVTKSYCQTAIGRFNSPTTTGYGEFSINNEAFAIGNGTDINSRGNAFKVLFNGQTYADGAYSGSGADYAEFFEWQDGNTDNEDRVGLFVSLDGDRIIKANSNSSYILGVVSGNPTIIGDNPMRWKNKYLTDEWGRPIYEDVEVKYTETEVDENGETTRVEKTRIDHIMKINPNWDPSLEYKSREIRPEWSAIGMMGKLLVKQDGTLKAGEFCYPNDNGIATKSESGYYVMKVMSENQALILFK